MAWHNLQIAYEVEAGFALWIHYGFEPGSFGMACLEGDLERAKRCAHVMLQRIPHCIEDHLEFVRLYVPPEAQGTNIPNWEGVERHPEIYTQLAVEAKLKGEPLWWEELTNRYKKT